MGILNNNNNNNTLIWSSFFNKSSRELPKRVNEDARAKQSTTTHNGSTKVPPIGLICSRSINLVPITTSDLNRKCEQIIIRPTKAASAAAATFVQWLLVARPSAWLLMCMSAGNKQLWPVSGPECWTVQHRTGLAKNRLNEPRDTLAILHHLLPILCRVNLGIRVSRIQRHDCV